MNIKIENIKRRSKMYTKILVMSLLRKICLMDYCIVEAAAVLSAVGRTCLSNDVTSDLTLRQNFSWFAVIMLLFVWNTASFGCSLMTIK